MVSIPLALALASASASARTAAEALTDPRILDGVCYGVIAGLTIYALQMYLTFRERMYVYFIVAAFWAIATIAILNGHFSSWLLRPEPDRLPERLAGAVLALWVAVATLFGHRFLMLPREAPRIGHAARALAALAGLAALASLGGAVQAAAWAVAALAAAGLLLVPLGARASKRHGWRFRGWYVGVIIMVLITLLLVVGSRLAWLNPAWATGRGLQLWIVLQTVIYALAMGLRLARLRAKQDELQHRASEWSRVARTDPLTMVANRAGLTHRAASALVAPAQGALLILDLDHFKPINDAFGHSTGDAVLVQIARRLVRLTNPLDMVARLGGDEFALLLTTGRSRAELALYAERAVAAVRAPLELGKHVHRVGASIGVARFPEDGNDLSSLLRRADQALYRVKRQGRDGFAFFDEPPAFASKPIRL